MIYSFKSVASSWFSISVCTAVLLLVGIESRVLGSEPRRAETIISPQTKDSGVAKDSLVSFPTYSVFVVACLAGAAWLWYRSSSKRNGKDGKKTVIVIDEVRALGNRQHLVLASCRGRSFLLGVSPGRIDRIAIVPPDETGR